MKHVSAKNSMTNASASLHHKYLFYLIKNSTKLYLVFYGFLKEYIINADLCRQIIQRLVNNKLEIMWNEAEGSKTRNDTDASMEIRRSMRKIGRNTQCPGNI